MNAQKPSNSGLENTLSRKRSSRCQVIGLSFLLIPLCISGLSMSILAAPKPGDIFSQYTLDLNNHPLSPNGFLRVGVNKQYHGTNIDMPANFDLDDAVRAEVVVEKNESHTGTKGLAVSVNDNPFHEFEPAAGIPAPMEQYKHFYMAEVEIPLSELKASGNVFKLKVDETTGSPWAQNLIYGIEFTVYYSASRPHPSGGITTPKTNGKLQWKADIAAEAQYGKGIKKIEFMGFYDDYPWNGDGVYRAWHHRWIKAVFSNHLGTAESAPYRITWDNSWVPDQVEPMKISARIHGGDGIIYMAEAVGGITFDRPGFSVEMCKPYSIPTGWIARGSGKQSKFDVKGDLSKTTAAKMIVSVWEYEGDPTFTINGKTACTVVTHWFGPWENAFPVDVLQQGTNAIWGEMDGEHGCEINCPGPVPFIQYGTKPDVSLLSMPDLHPSTPAAHLNIRYEPGRNTVLLQTGLAGSHTIEFIRLDGRVCKVLAVSGEQRIWLKMDDVQPGIYVVRISDRGGPASHRLVSLR